MSYLIYCYAERCHAEFHCAGCRYEECRYAQCLGAEAHEGPHLCKLHSLALKFQARMEMS